MRLLELRLAAVGHFTDVTLPLDTPHPAFHLIFGRNEAGKSTTLRAIRYLLYGFPDRTSDNFLHAKPRVGARLALNESETLEIVRRKGRKRTLLDPNERTLDEACLARALSGVGEEQFVTMFGLNHDALRRGGEALLAGRGNVGESLFDAGTGGRGIHQVLQQLESDADTLFRPRGRRTALNEAIDRFRESVRRTQTTGIDPAAARAQRAALESEKSRKRELDQSYRQVRTKLDTTRRNLKALPALRERQRLQRELEAAGPVPQISSDDVRNREALQRELERSAVAARQHAEELARLESRREALETPEPIADVAPDIIRDIENRRGGLLKALADLPHREAELRAHEDDVTRALEALGRDAARSNIDSLRVPKELVARVAALAQERGALFAKHEESETSLEAIQQDRQRLQSERGALPQPNDTTELRAALAAADALGDVEKQRLTLLTKAQLLARREEDRRAALGQLTRGLSAEALRALSVPSSETVDRFRREFQLGDEIRERAQRQLETAQTIYEDAQTKLSTLTRGGDVPSEEALDRTREDRNRVWGVIRRSLDSTSDDGAAAPPRTRQAAGRSRRASKAATPSKQATLSIERPDPEFFDQLLRKSDELADRLRREAGRVAQHAELVAAASRSQTTIERAQGDLDQAATDRGHLEAQWLELWESVNVTPLPPDEMRSWISRFEQWRQTAEELATAEAALQEVDSLTTDRSLGLRSALCGLYSGSLNPGGRIPDRDSDLASRDLASLRQRARDALDVSQASDAARQRIGLELTQADDRAKKEQQRLKRRADAISEWRREWALTVEPLGLGAEARTEEARAILEQLDQVHKRAELADSVRRRIEGMKRDERQFSERVAPLVREYAPDLAERALDEQADALVQRHRHAVAQRVRREELDQAIHARREELEKAEDAASAVQEILEHRMKDAGVETLSDLALMEERARRIELLRTELDTNEKHLRALTEGEDLDRIAHELKDVEARDLRVEAQDLENEVAAVEDEREALQERIVHIEHGLDNQQSRAQASAAAADAQLALTQVRTLGHRYVRLRLAATVIRREIDRYRERNQGPVLSRAGELFPKLTNGRYRGLKVGFTESDEEVLKCVRNDGTEVAVEHLSDGSQDQLYLALRLASLERFQSVHGTLPLILDDVFLHFDEDRARTALSVLGEYSQRGQVLFFTHQARLRELAEQAIKPEQLDIHDLDDLRQRHVTADTSG